MVSMTDHTTVAEPGSDAPAMTMQAIVYDTYGSPDVLELMNIDKPVPGDGEVLVRVRAAALNPGDWHFVRGVPYSVRLITGLRQPKRPTVLGADLAGQVEAVGRNVTRLRPGDEVFGRTRSAHRPERPAAVETGACAEYACVPENLLAPKPANLTFEQAAAIPFAGLTALQAFRDAGRVQPGQRVLINGASGGVGTTAVQLARSFGAHVTAACSTDNVELVRSLGADHVIDSTRADFTERAGAFDLILDLADRSLPDLLRALRPTGTLVLVGGSPGRWIDGIGRSYRARLLSPLVSQKLRAFLTRYRQADLVRLRELCEAGTLAPVIDRTYSMDEAPNAMRYLEGGHVRGKIVITM